VNLKMRANMKARLLMKHTPLSFCLVALLYAVNLAGWLAQAQTSQKEMDESVRRSAEAQKQSEVRKVKEFQECKAKAEAGDAAAQFALAHRYKVGEGVKTDPVEEKKWVLKSAMLGHGAAQWFAARGYTDSAYAGWKADLVEAYAWTTLATKSKPEDYAGPDSLASRHHMSAPQVAAGKKRAAELAAQIEANRKAIPAKPQTAGK